MNTQTLNILYRTRQVGIRALFYPVPQPQRVQSKFTSLVSTVQNLGSNHLGLQMWMSYHKICPRQLPCALLLNWASQIVTELNCVYKYGFLTLDPLDCKHLFCFRMREDSARVYENVGLMQQQKSFRWEDVQRLPCKDRYGWMFRSEWNPDWACGVWRKCTQNQTMRRTIERTF